MLSVVVVVPIHTTILVWHTCGLSMLSLCVWYFVCCVQEVKAYEEKFYTPLSAARHGFLDDVIRPSETRQRLIRELRLLKHKQVSRPWKKHGNIPL